jgi:putative FmdB family regulatory protein
MPTYVFKCTGCNEQFEAVLTIAERLQGPDPSCPKCKSDKVERVYSAFTAKTSKKS